MYLRKTCRKTTNSAHHKTKVILYILEVGIFFYFIKFTLARAALYQSIFLDVQHLANFADMQFRQIIRLACERIHPENQYQ